MASVTSSEERVQVPQDWDAAKIPSLDGKTVIVTGANSGIGYVTALELVRHGAHVVLACRSEQKGNDAVKQIRAELASTPVGASSASANSNIGDVEFMQLDVSSLASVRTFADRFKQTHTRLDILVNNAGIMAVPYALTVDGIESQFATNHLGHFALTAQLYDTLQASAPARIVNVSSVMHRLANLTPSSTSIVSTEAEYMSLRAYANSKLCNLLFSAELTRRQQARGVDGVTAVTAHPGFTATNLFVSPTEKSNWFGRQFWALGHWLAFGQPVSVGALPTLFAATAREVHGGDFYGPRNRFLLRGAPALEEPTATSKSKTLAAQLWRESERLAGMSFEL